MEQSRSKRALTRRDFMCLSGAVGAASLLQAREASTARGPKHGGTLTMARPNSMQDFNGVWYTLATFPFVRALYDTLITLDKDSNPQPQLAESWQFSPDGLTLTLRLRQGVKFHSGADFTSENVKASWDHAVAEDVGRGSQLRSLFRLVEDIKTPDKYTVQLSRNTPNPLIWDILDTLSIHDITRLDQLNRTDAGSGPYYVSRYTPNQEVRMKRFDGYWQKDKAFLDEYVVRQIPDVSTLVIHLESKALDAVEGASFTEIARLGKQPGLVTHSQVAAPSRFMVAPNPNRKPFDNKKVRQAISYAIDRGRFCRTVLQGMTEPTCVMYAKGSWVYNADLEDRYKYDPEKAKSLLREAGYGDGFETSILTSKQFMDPFFGLAQLIQNDLAKVGIRVKIEDVESTAYNLRWRKSEWDMVINAWGRANRDPGTMLTGSTVWYPKSENGPIGYEHPDYVRWRREAGSTLDREKRKPLYRKIEELVLDECWVIAIADSKYFWVTWDYVKNVSFTPEFCTYVGDLWLDK